jgi:flagellar biosynthetic protein FlhB
MAGERTEQASAHRREQARKDGDILHSRDLSAAAATLAGVMTLGALGNRTLLNMRITFAGFLDLGMPARWEPSAIQPTLFAIRKLAMVVLGPPATIMAAVAATALAAGVLQTGGINFHPQLIGFKPDRVNPVSNIKNLFSLRAVARLAKSLVPAGFLAVIAVHRIAHQLETPPFSITRIENLGSDVYGLLLTAAWLLFGWSAIDYAVEWQSRESRLKMSRDDQREEMKQTEGSPQIKGRIRNLQRQARRRRVKNDVAKSAVVLTNPTHYAVALGFDFQTMEAPKVMAKGRNLLAEEIKAEARWAGVPIIENPPLARSLYRSVEVGQAIPAELYAAVAAILAYLYRQRVEAEVRERRAQEASARARAQAEAARRAAGRAANAVQNQPGDRQASSFVPGVGDPARRSPPVGSGLPPASPNPAGGPA